jgi:glutathione S-transferase
VRAVAGAGAAPVAAAAAPAVHHAAPGAVAAAVGTSLSAAVLGIVGRPSLASAQGHAALNASLATRSYVAGHTPTAEDDAAFRLLQAAGHTDGARLAAAGFPNAGRWLNHVASFTAAERAEWPLTFGQLTSGAVDARVSTLFSA